MLVVNLPVIKIFGGFFLNVPTEYVLIFSIDSLTAIRFKFLNIIKIDKTISDYVIRAVTEVRRVLETG